LDEFLASAEFARICLFAATLVFPLRLILLDRHLTTSEVAGAGLGIAVWLGFLGRRRNPSLATGVAVMAAIVISGLAPFHFLAEPQGFSWTPFQAVLGSPWSDGLVILLQKSFLYGAAIWCLRASAGQWIVPTLGVSAVIGGLEVIQRYLPGRTPEITDPVLALLLGVVLSLSTRPADSHPVAEVCERS